MLKTVQWVALAFSAISPEQCFGSAVKIFRFQECVPLRELVEREHFTKDGELFFRQAGQDRITLKGRNQDLSCDGGCSLSVQHSDGSSDVYDITSSHVVWEKDVQYSAPYAARVDRRYHFKITSKNT